MTHIASLAFLVASASATGVFDVTKYGAVGDGITVDSKAIRAAAAAVADAGGGTLLFPATKGGHGKPPPSCPAVLCPHHSGRAFWRSNSSW